MSEKNSIPFHLDMLAEDVKLGVRLIREPNKKLKQVETEVRDAFRELDEKPEAGQE